MKEYKSNKELIEYLESKNVRVINKKEALSIIDKYSYYSIVNSYKNIFKDKERIEVRTDNRDFFLYSVESLGDMGYLLNDVSFNYQSPDLIMTEYESKFRGKGANIYHFFAEK